MIIVRKLVSPLMLALGMAALTACGLFLDADARLERAKQAYAGNDFAAAIVDLKTLLQDDPDHIDARLLLAESLFRSGDFVGAENEFERGVTLLRGAGVTSRPNAEQELIEATGKLAALQLGLRDFPAALANAQIVLTADPDNVASYVIASQSAYYSGDNSASRSYAARLLERSPDNPLAHAMLGLIDAREGAHAEAEAHFISVLAQQPDHRAVRLALTQLQIIMGKHDAAVVTLSPLLVVFPTDENLLQLVDVMQLGTPEALARVDEAATAIEASNQTSPVPGILRGRARMLARDFRAASTEFQEAIDKGGGRYPLIGYYVAQRALGSNSSAQTALEQWVESNPADQAAGFLLASTYIEQEEDERARELYEKLIGAVEVDSPIVLNNLAWLYGEVNDPRAIETARQAHQQAPDNGAITDTLGWLLVEAGQIDEGIQLLRLAVQQEPESEEIRLHLTAALAQIGEQDDAGRLIERILGSSSEAGPDSSADAPQ